MLLKSSTIFLLHLELKPKNGFKLKTGFEFRRSVSVRDYSFKKNLLIYAVMAEWIKPWTLMIIILIIMGTFYSVHIHSSSAQGAGSQHYYYPSHWIELQYRTLILCTFSTPWGAY